MIKETLKVTGMHCPKCTARVEKTVGAIDGVESVAADFEADKVELAYDGQPSALTGQRVNTVLAAVKAAIAAEDFVVED